MRMYDLGEIPAVPGMVAALVMMISAACASPTATVEWPQQAPTIEAPAVTADDTPRLVRSDSGLLFAVGQFETTPAVGDAVFGRFDGAWPLERMEAPALFAGVVADVRSDEIVQVHPFYEFPDVEIDELRVEFGDGFDDESMGKGIARVEDVNFEAPAHVTLTLGPEAGVRQGDMYALMDEIDDDGGVEAAQLTRRLVAVCMVIDVEEGSSRCRLRQGHPQHRWAGSVSVGQQALFLEPTFGTAPNRARVLVSTTGDEDVDERVVQYLNDYLTRFPGGEVTVELFDREVDAEEVEFYRWSRRVQVEGPAILVGVSLIDDERGRTRVVANYTGLGSAIGPGMVAAPPEGGVDMGGIDELDEGQWTGLASVVMGAVLVYRGQNSEALSHLHDALRDRRLSGPLRWHARDQYAMRWAALDRFDEAFWLVAEDEAVAVADDDKKATQNALGTLVRLHHHVDQHDLALEKAKRFMQAYVDDRESTNYAFALSMKAEMAAAAGEVEIAREALDELDELCPDGCEGDLLYMLAGVYWTADDEDYRELQDRVVERMVEISQGDRGQLRAAARMFQAWTFMRDDNFEQALIAFLEAQRLYERDHAYYGAARAQFFIAITQVRLGNHQQAFEQGLDALEFMTSVRDYGSMVRIYGQLSNLFLSVDPSGPPQRFLGAAPRVMRTHLDRRLATGNLAWASEAAFGYGVFMRFVGEVEQARQILQRGVLYGLRAAHLEVVARCHIQLALVARMAGDEAGFHQEMQLAQIIAEAIDDPALDEEIEQVLEPSEEEPDDPTQFL